LVPQSSEFTWGCLQQPLTSIPRARWR